ncbi:MAG TPA: hypothetical protein EYP49_16570 [Anaerolineae bacterium]|nr:hypothetical protein [Anaerolineae bacterium]
MVGLGVWVGFGVWVALGVGVAFGVWVGFGVLVGVGDSVGLTSRPGFSFSRASLALWWPRCEASKALFRPFWAASGASACTFVNTACWRSVRLTSLSRRTGLS